MLILPYIFKYFVDIKAESENELLSLISIFALHNYRTISSLFM